MIICYNPCYNEALATWCFQNHDFCDFHNGCSFERQLAYLHSLGGIKETKGLVERIEHCNSPHLSCSTLILPEKVVKRTTANTIFTAGQKTFYSLLWMVAKYLTSPSQVFKGLPAVEPIYLLTNCLIGQHSQSSSRNQQ